MDKMITETGRWGRDIFGQEMWVINCSSILSKLIKVAGNNVDNYSSDLFISWNEIEEELKNREYDGGMYKFGFRNSGVDHLEWIERNKEEANYYSDIYVLTIVVDRDEMEITMTLYREQPEIGKYKCPPKYRYDALEDAVLQHTSDVMEKLIKDFGIELLDSEKDEFSDLISMVASYVERKAF